MFLSYLFDCKLVLEVAIFISREKGLHYLNNALPQYLIHLNPSRLYFGNEFCQCLIPSLKDLKIVLSTAFKKDLSFSLVTPFVTDGGMKRLIPLFNFFSDNVSPVEVIVNDWGVLHLMGEYPSLKPVLGRLMNRMVRDPRIARYYTSAEALEKALKAIQQSSITALSYRNLLKDYGVNRVEFDNLYQGLDLNLKEMGLGGSLYIPYGYVTTGRICMIGSFNSDSNAKSIPPNSCVGDCDRYLCELSSNCPPGTPGLFQKGNTVFFFQDEDTVVSALSGAKRLGIDRIIYQPEIPM